ncbi:MAG: TonB-dependent receptor plug domain-containing protein [Pseudomonadota bacterium]
MRRSFAARPLALAMAGLLTTTLLLPAQAQELEPLDDDASTVTYGGEFFEQYEPNTVNDMLDRIPGIALALDSNDDGNSRGLGNEDQILINGQRMAGKANEARNQLSRIAANQVDYIEIIRGTSSSLGARSSGLMVNIVLLEAASRSSISAEANVDFYDDDTVSPGASVSLNGQRGALGYVLSAASEPRYEQRDSFEYNFLGDWTPAGTIYRNEVRERDDVSLSTNLTWDLSLQDRIQFNAQLENRDAPMTYDREITDLLTDPPEERFEHEFNDATDERWEIGGNYEHIFTNADRFRFLVIVNETDQGSIRQRYSRETPDEEGDKTLFMDTSSTEQERIARTSWIHDLGASQGLEIGVERAQTILDSSLAIGLPGAGEPSPETGGLVPVAFPNADSRVEEMRYETFAIHNWQLNPSMSLESSLTWETSEITQTGDTRNQRDFDFIRPKFDFRYDITSTLQVRARVERFISQLSFDQFVAAADTDDEQRDATAGNPDLVQEKAWQYELNMEYRLPDDNGVLNARVFYHDLEDVIDRVAIPTQSGDLLSGPGNIGDAWKAGLALDASTRLSYFGLPDAIVTAGVQVEDSEVTDPFLGIDRRLQRHGRGSVSLGFRHDITRQNITYGFDYRDSFNDGLKRYDIQQIESFNADAFMVAYLQKVAFGGVTFRLESMNFLDTGRCRIRTRYPERIRETIPSLIEDSCSNAGRKYAIKIRSTF